MIFILNSLFLLAAYMMLPIGIPLYVINILGLLLAGYNLYFYKMSYKNMKKWSKNEKLEIKMSFFLGIVVFLFSLGLLLLGNFENIGFDYYYKNSFLSIFVWASIISKAIIVEVLFKKNIYEFFEKSYGKMKGLWITLIIMIICVDFFPNSFANGIIAMVNLFVYQKTNKIELIIISNICYHLTLLFLTQIFVQIIFRNSI